MEAIGSGTAVIGLNVKYGNRLFVHSEENGYLVDFDSSYVDNDSAHPPYISIEISEFIW
mgnify:CR=1 FL=1